MLFSNELVAALINNQFEAVWESVRPVPLVHIDFGNGRHLTRTLHGNIATAVCDSDGRVLDILPGIYEPQTYLDRLQNFILLHRWFDQQDQSEQAWMRLHASQARLLAQGQEPLVLAPPPADLTKTLRIERPVKLVLSPAPATTQETKTGTPPVPAGLDSEMTGTLWQSLAADTRVNETTRRRQIHQSLSQTGLGSPDEITPWLYREVLHADLDDPYLGLGETLFADFPFKQ